MSGKEFHLIKELTYSRLTAICAFEPPFLCLPFVRIITQIGLHLLRKMLCSRTANSLERKSRLDWLHTRCRVVKNVIPPFLRQYLAFSKPFFWTQNPNLKKIAGLKVNSNFKRPYFTIEHPPMTSASHFGVGNNKTTAMLIYQTNPVAVELFPF